MPQIDLSTIQLDQKPDYTDPNVRNATLLSVFGEQPYGQYVDLSQIKLDTPVSPAKKQEDKGFFSRVSDDFAKRRDITQNIASLYRSGQQSLPESILQITGKGVVGLANDVVGEGFASLGHGLSAVTPNIIEDPIKQGAKDVFNSIADSPIGDLARSAGAKYEDFANSNPHAARNVEALANIGSVYAAATPIKGTSAIDTAVAVPSSAAKSAVKAAVPKADAGLAETALLAQKHNIPLSMDQVSTSKPVKTMQKLSQELPFSGQEAFKERQRLDWQRGIFKTIGMDADRFTPKNMETAFKKVGGEFDNLTKGKEFTIGQDFIAEVATKGEELLSTQGKEAADTFNREALKVIDDFSKGDTISGDLIGKQRARVNALARKASPAHAEALYDLENIIVDGITSGDPAIEQALKQAKYRYKNLIAVEPLAVKAKGGMISPSLLNDRVSRIYGRPHTIGQAGDLGELARVGYELLPELGGSDTAQKLIYAKALGGMGALATGFVNPLIPLVAGGVVGANRLGQSLSRNQGIIGLSLSKAKKEPLRLTITPKDKLLP